MYFADCVTLIVVTGNKTWIKNRMSAFGILVVSYTSVQQSPTSRLHVDAVTNKPSYPTKW